MKRSTSNNLNKPIPPIPEKQKLPDKILFDDIHKKVKSDTKSHKVQPVDPLPANRSPFRITSLIRKFTLLFLVYTLLAHLFCHSPITADSSDLCQRHQGTLEYFEPVYYDHIHPVVHPRIQQAQQKLEPVTNQLIKLEPYLSKSKNNAQNLYNRSIHPRLEIQSKRLLNKYKPVYDKWGGHAAEQYNRYYIPLSKNEHVLRLAALTNQFQQHLEHTYTTVHPHLRVIYAYTQRQLIHASSTAWSYTRTYYPHVHSFLTKYTKRVIAEWLALSRKITGYVSRLALGQYVKLGLDDKLINVDHFKHLKGKFLDPVLTRLGEWVDQQRTNTATIYTSSVETADELGDFIKTMGESTADEIDNTAAAAEPTTSSEPVVEEVVDPALKLQAALVSLNESHSVLADLLDSASISYAHQLTSQRTENTRTITHSAEHALIAIERDFKRLVDGYREYHERELSAAVEDADTQHQHNIESVRAKVINKLRSISQDSLNHLVQWQNDIDEAELSLMANAFAESRTQLTQKQREVGSTLAWTDGITYRDWQRYHDLARTYEDRVEELHRVQEDDDVVEPLFEQLFKDFIDLESVFEKQVEAVGRIGVESESAGSEGEGAEGAEKEDDVASDATFEDDNGDEQVEESTGREFNEHSPLTADDDEEGDSADGVNGTIFDVPDYPTSSASSQIPEATPANTHAHEEL